MKSNMDGCDYAGLVLHASPSTHPLHHHRAVGVRRRALLALLSASSLFSTAAHSKDERPVSLGKLSCTALYEPHRKPEVLVEGTCNVRVSPASTFKIPLAVMGFDSGILVDSLNPAWESPGSVAKDFGGVRNGTPLTWQSQSLVWYSRELTRTLGRSRLERYVHQFDYGNVDVSRGPGNTEGFTSSWIGGSLAISPLEQVRFVDRLLTNKLPASVRAQQATMAIIPKFQTAGGWTVHGKTGSTWVHDKTGKALKDQPIGWFVGWAQREGRTVVFSRLDVDNRTTHSAHGLQVRDRFLSEIDMLLR